MALSLHRVDFFTEKHGEIRRVTRGYRQLVCALAQHLSFLCFSRKSVTSH